MHSSDSAVQQFILQHAANPLGTTLRITTRNWALEQGWEDPCGGYGSILGPHPNPYEPGCPCQLPPTIDESVRSAAATLAAQGALIWQDRMDMELGRTITHLAIPGSAVDDTPPGPGGDQDL